MTTYTLNHYGTTLEITDCPDCGVTFAMPERMLDVRRSDRKSFYCPNGHSLSFKKSTEDRLRTQLEQYKSSLISTRDQLEATERSRNAYKGVITRQKNRAAAGVCPAGCHRHFADLQGHMETKHPDYVNTDAHA